MIYFMSFDADEIKVSPESVGAVPPRLAGGAGEEPPLPPRPAMSLWSWRDLALFVGFGALALMLSNLLALAGYAGLRPIMGWHTPTQALPDNPFFLLTLQSIFYALLFGYIYLLIVVHYGRPFWTGVQWRNPTAPQSFGYFLGGILLAVAVQFAPTLLPDKETFPLERLFSSPQAAYAVAAFAVLIAPFMEELIFRGVLFSFFETKIGLRFAVVSTAVFFAGLHVPEYWGAWNHVFLILLVGVMFSLARGLTGSLAPSIILHLAYNASLMTGLFIGTQHFRMLHTIFAR